MYHKLTHSLTHTLTQTPAGDGTFLEATKYVRGSLPVFGLNTDPGRYDVMAMRLNNVIW